MVEECKGYWLIIILDTNHPYYSCILLPESHYFSFWHSELVLSDLKAAFFREKPTSLWAFLSVF